MRTVSWRFFPRHPSFACRRPSATSSAALLVPVTLALALLGCGERFDGGPPTALSGGAGGSTTSSGTAGSAGGGAGGAGGSSTTTGGAGGVGGSPCISTALFDTFDGTVLSDLWKLQPAENNTFGVEGGVLFATLPPAPSPVEFYVNVRSVQRYDMRGCAAWIEVPTPLPAGEQAQIYLGIWVVADEQWFECGTDKEEFLCRAEQPLEPPAEMDRIPFDPSSHRWWRIRDTGLTTVFETSGDGWSYDQVWSRPSPDHLEAVEVFVGAGTWGVTQDTLRVEFDNFNALPPQSP